jgi:hypothetical protein
MTPDLIFEGPAGNGEARQAGAEAGPAVPGLERAGGRAGWPTLPTDRDELLAAAVSAVVEIDAAIMRGDDAAAELAPRSTRRLSGR